MQKARFSHDAAQIIPYRRRMTPAQPKINCPASYFFSKIQAIYGKVVQYNNVTTHTMYPGIDVSIVSIVYLLRGLSMLWRSRKWALSKYQSYPLRLPGFHYIFSRSV